MQLLKRTKLNIALSMFLSIIASKLVYYTLKSAFINFGFVEGDLITTNLWMQLGTGAFVTLIFYLIWIKSGLNGKLSE
jgi:tryptophan-rich sensory protein